MVIKDNIQPMKEKQRQTLSCLPLLGERTHLVGEYLSNSAKIIKYFNLSYNLEVFPI